MRHILILLSILLLSYPLFGDNHKEGLGKVFFLPVKTESHKIIKTKKLEALKIRAFEKGMSDAFIRDFS